MNEKIFAFTLCAMLLALSLPAQAQQPKKVPRIGYLSVLSFSAMADRIETFRQGLRELGYVEGKNINIEWRYGEEKPDRVSELAAELVRLKVDVIISGGNSATQAAKKATNTISIVMTRG
jgi:putative tryptophan/tyrosine transport system substrate-binding protein